MRLFNSAIICQNKISKQFYKNKVIDENKHGEISYIQVHVTANVKFNWLI